MAGTSVFPGAQLRRLNICVILLLLRLAALASEFPDAVRGLAVALVAARGTTSPFNRPPDGLKSSASSFNKTSGLISMVLRLEIFLIIVDTLFRDVGWALPSPAIVALLSGLRLTFGPTTFDVVASAVRGDCSSTDWRRASGLAEVREAV